MNSIIELENVSHSYSKGVAVPVPAIRNVNIKIKKGETVGIIGHTGSGKSTLISHFNGLLKPDSGRVLINGEDIWKDKTALKNAKFKIGLCFQYPEYQLFEETVYKDIAFGPKNMKLGDDEIKKRVFEAASFCNVKPELLEKSPFDLSGGEKRRVAIAGVMAMMPQALIFDEPAAGLDPQGRRELISLIKRYKENTDSAVVIVSHSMDEIAETADRLLVMNDSEIVMDGTVDEVFSRGEELIAMGLNIPEITKIFIELKKRGLDVPTNVYTVKKGVEILKR